jgi:hypothetical protein
MSNPLEACWRSSKRGEKMVLTTPSTSALILSNLGIYVICDSACDRSQSSGDRIVIREINAWILIKIVTTHLELAVFSDPGTEDFRYNRIGHLKIFVSGHPVATYNLFSLKWDASFWKSNVYLFRHVPCSFF